MARLGGDIIDTDHLSRFASALGTLDAPASVTVHLSGVKPADLPR
jgi:hypothetical protein